MRPGDLHNVPEEAPYRNRIQGYLFNDDITDNRVDATHGVTELLMITSMVLVGFFITDRIYNVDSNSIDHVMGEALLVAQDIENLFDQIQERNN